MQTRLAWCLLSLAGVVAVACDRGASPGVAWQPTTGRYLSSTQPAENGPAYLAVLEAVFRHQFDHNASAGQRRVDYFFLELADDQDPPAELMARFANEKPAVLPGSMSTISRAEGVKHKDLGGSGLIFNIGRFMWIDSNTVDVDGGYYEAGLSASGNTYRVERRDGKWNVTKDEMHWIS